MALLLRIVEMLTQMCRSHALDERDDDFDYDDDHARRRGRAMAKYVEITTSCGRQTCFLLTQANGSPSRRLLRFSTAARHDFTHLAAARSLL
jgi:hypothetical protein